MVEGHGTRNWSLRKKFCGQARRLSGSVTFHCWWRFMMFLFTTINLAPFEVKICLHGRKAKRVVFLIFWYQNVGEFGIGSYFTLRENAWTLGLHLNTTLGYNSLSSSFDWDFLLLIFLIIPCMKICQMAIEQHKWVKVFWHSFVQK